MGHRISLKKVRPLTEWLLRLLPALTARDSSKAAEQTAIQQQYLATISINHMLAYVFWIVFCLNYIYG